MSDGYILQCRCCRELAEERFLVWDARRGVGLEVCERCVTSPDVEGGWLFQLAARAVAA